MHIVLFQQLSRLDCMLLARLNLYFQLVEFGNRFDAAVSKRSRNKRRRVVVEESDEDENESNTVAMAPVETCRHFSAVCNLFIGCTCLVSLFSF